MQWETRGRQASLLQGLYGGSDHSDFVQGMPCIALTSGTSDITYTWDPTWESGVGGGFDNELSLFSPQRTPLGCLLTHWKPFGLKNLRKVLHDLSRIYQISSVRSSKQMEIP